MPSCCSVSPSAVAVTPMHEDKVVPESVQYDMATPQSQARKGKKPLESKKSANQQTFNGKTYACIACKNGHRVRLCNHGYKRPISATNQPGRPSSGSKRKCTCPKSCPCSEKDGCRCERNCVCVETMYLIVHVSKQLSPTLSNASQLKREPSPTLSRVNEEGKEEFLKKVYTDLNGKQLSDTEMTRRIEEREKREQNHQNHKQEPKLEELPKPPFQFNNISYDLTPNREQSGGRPTPPSSTLSDSKPSCCSHASSASPTPILYQPTPTHQPSLLHRASAQGCNCGASCQCIHCPEHANNAPTLQYNHQQFAHMANNAYLPSDFQIPGPLFRPEIPQASCMGGPTTFRLSSRPPEPAEYSQMFPDAIPGSYVMQYEVRRTPQPGYQQYVEEMNSTGPYQLPELPSSHIPLDEMVVDQHSEPVPLDFDSVIDDDFIGWDSVVIGDASVNQIPAVIPPTVFPQSMSYSAPLNTPGVYASYAQPMALSRGGSTSSNTFNNITSSDFASPAQTSFRPDPHLPVRDRPSGTIDNRFISVDGPFMGHPASPVPRMMSPVAVCLNNF